MSSEQQASSNLIEFHFKETEKDTSTFLKRCFNEAKVTNFKNFFASDDEILKGVETVRKYQAMAGEAKDGVLHITAEEKQQILRGIELKNSCCNSDGDLVFKPFRMCGFMCMKTPIYCGIFLTKPTYLNTAIWQWANQSYNAGLNFGNKNVSCPYSDHDLVMGYSAAVVSSVGLSLIMRKLTEKQIAKATGKKFLLINLLVNASAAGAANWCNTMCMRHCEMKKGIKIYSDD